MQVCKFVSDVAFINLLLYHMQQRAWMAKFVRWKLPLLLIRWLIIQQSPDGYSYVCLTSGAISATQTPTTARDGTQVIVEWRVDSSGTRIQVRTKITTRASNNSEYKTAIIIVFACVCVCAALLPGPAMDTQYSIGVTGCFGYETRLVDCPLLIETGCGSRNAMVTDCVTTGQSKFVTGNASAWAWNSV